MRLLFPLISMNYCGFISTVVKNVNSEVRLPGFESHFCQGYELRQVTFSLPQFIYRIGLMIVLVSCDCLEGDM